MGQTSRPPKKCPVNAHQNILILLMAKILCPYCYRHFDSKEAMVQCGNDRIGADGNYECEHSEYAEYARFWGAGNPIGHIFPAARGFLGFGGLKKKQVCDLCSKENIDRFVCPHCYNRIPTEMIENGAEIISVIGFPNSGKTNYIIALVHELSNKGYTLGIDVVSSQIHPDGTKFAKFATDQRFNEMQKTLFRDKEFLQKTTIKQNYIPLIFKLYQRSSNKTIYLVFYDTAGEDFTDSNRMKNSETLKYLRESSGLIILADPFSIEQVTDVLQKRYADNGDFQIQAGQNQGNDATSLMALKNTLAESLMHIESIYKKPVAFVFSKFDIIINNKDLFDFSVDAFKEGNTLKDSSFINDKKVDVANINATSTAIEGYLDTWGQHFFTEWVKNWAANPKNPDSGSSDNMYKFFGVSATGSMSEAGQLKSVVPYRVMDPLIWVLLKLGKFNIPTK